MTAFEEFGVMPEIARAVEDMEWNLPTDVQAEAIPLILGGGDVLMAAETGSGKTGAFCLPIVQSVWESLRDAQLAATKPARTGTVASPAPDSAAVRPWTISARDRDPALSVQPDGLRCQARAEREWHGARATSGVRALRQAADRPQRYHFEATVTDEGLCRIGWSTARAARDLGTDAFGFGFGGTGKKAHARQFDDFGQPFGLGDCIGCTIDFDRWSLEFSRNGQPFGQAFAVPPALRGETFYPALLLKNAELRLNFGQEPFRWAPADVLGCSGAAPASTATNPREAAGHQPAAAASQSSAAVAASPNAPQAIVLEPSRELAEQTAEQLRLFGRHLPSPLRVLLLVGGVAVRDQTEALRSGVDVVVATPGRLDDLIAGGHLSLASVRFYVLDEADALLKAGHTRLIESLHARMPRRSPAGHRLQMVVCSATLHAHDVRRLAGRLLEFPVWIDLKGEDAVPETVHHCVVRVDPALDDSWTTDGQRIRTDGVHEDGRLDGAERRSQAVKWLKGAYLVHAIDVHRIDRALLFCRTKLDCDNCERWLRAQGDADRYSCVCLHGDRPPKERTANLDAFRAGRVRFLICTDVAARGLDIRELPFVINVTLPDEKTNYVHRIGRVGRADRMGLAISLVSSVPEKVWYHGSWCSSHGKNCQDRRLTSDRGCCIWFNELGMLAEIEEYLNVTVDQIDAATMHVPCNEFDGRVVYGQRRSRRSRNAYRDHVGELGPQVKRLGDLERGAQLAFLRRAYEVAE